MLINLPARLMFNVFILLSGWICLHGVFDYTKPALSRVSNALIINVRSFHFVIVFAKKLCMTIVSVTEVHTRVGQHKKEVSYMSSRPFVPLSYRTRRRT